MFKKILCLILILKLTQARYDFVPKFYGQDSAVIVDTNKFVTQNKNSAANYPNKIRMPPPFPLWRHYPRYHIIPPPPPGQILAINTWAKTANAKSLPVPITKSTTTTSSTSTTTTAKPTILKTIGSSSALTDDEFPNELLDIAQNKLGLKSIDEIPSISEFSQILGTNSPEETLNFIKQLTLNEQGVALMKAYIESTDYTDNSGDLNQKNDDRENEEDDEMDTDADEPLKVNDEGLIVITDEDSIDDYELNDSREQTEDSPLKITLKPRVTSKIRQNLKELPQTQPSFMERIANYMHLNNLFHKNAEDNENKEYHELNRITENGKKVSNKEESQPKDNQENQTESEITKDLAGKAPILVRESIPYNYPVPIRVQSVTTTTTTVSPSTLSGSSNTPVVHLNTPKIFIPHVQQLSRVTKIPSKQIEDFLASKPKLLELATKVSRFPIGYDRNSAIEAQVMAVVQKAFEQDDDLQKLLSSASTLK